MAFPDAPDLAADGARVPWEDPRPCFKFPDARLQWEAELRGMKMVPRFRRQTGPAAARREAELFTIYAWNEFGEGGIVAPTRGEQTMKLDAIRAVFSSASAVLARDLRCAAAIAPRTG